MGKPEMLQVTLDGLERQAHDALAAAGVDPKNSDLQALLQSKREAVASAGMILYKIQGLRRSLEMGTECGAVNAEALAKAVLAAMELKDHQRNLNVLRRVRTYEGRLPRWKRLTKSTDPEEQVFATPQDVILMDADRGAKSPDSGRKGHNAVHGDPAEKQSRWQEYQNALEGLLERSPRLSLTEARRRVADTFGCSPKTVARHTVNPRKRKK